MRLGGLILLGAALLAAGALGLEWRYAPALLRHSLVQEVLVGAGLLVLLAALLALGLDRPASVPAPDGPSPAESASPEPSLMTLPAIVGEESAIPPSEPAPAFDSGGTSSSIQTPSSTIPAGLAAEGPGGSTLLIPFAEGLASGSPPSSIPGSGQTVTRLVDRIDALQRVAPTSSPRAASPVPPEKESLASSLLLRLTRIPNPPAASATMEAARRCNDCGEPLGFPPHFEPCADCGRALCERCYWHTSSGPQAHLCTACIRERSVPRPPVPALTFSRPSPVASVSAPSNRTLQPRRPVS